MQLPSTAENTVHDTSIAVICGLAISNRRDSPWQRSESAARATDAALGRAIAIEHRKKRWRYTAVSPWRQVRCIRPSQKGGTAASRCQGGAGFQQEKWIPPRAVGEQTEATSGGSTPVIDTRCFPRAEWPER